MSNLIIENVKYNFEQNRTIYDYICTNAPGFLWKDHDGIVSVHDLFKDARHFLSFSGNFPEKQWWRPDFKIFCINIIHNKGYVIPVINPYFQFVCINCAYFYTIFVWSIWKCLRHFWICDVIFKRVFPDFFFKPLEKNRPKFFDFL